MPKSAGATRSLWHDLTKQNITRLRAAYALAPHLTVQERAALLHTAAGMIQAQQPDPKRYWPAFLNTVRILLAAEADVMPSTSSLFTATAGTASYCGETDAEGRFCALPGNHGGPCQFPV